MTDAFNASAQDANFDRGDYRSKINRARPCRRSSRDDCRHPFLRTNDAIYLEQRRVCRNDAEIHFSPREYGVLAELSKHPGRIVGHARLLRDVWGPAHEQKLEYLRIVIRNLRQKLEPDPARPVIITNEPGVGYRLAATR